MTDYPFIDNTYPANPVYGPEALVSPLNGVGLYHAPKPPPGDRLSKPVTELAKRWAALFNEVHPDSEPITDAEIPEGLLRALELIDADPDQNVANFAKARVQTVRTAVGSAISVPMLVNPAAVLSDPTNGRILQHIRGLRGGNTVEVVGETDLGVPVLQVSSAQALIAMVEDARHHLGFLGPGDIANQKDLSDLISIGLQGIHSEITLVPVLFRDDSGAEGYFFVAIDGNRRLEMARSVTRLTTGLTDDEVVSSLDHLFTESSVMLRDADADDVRNARRKALYHDVRGGQWEPEGHSRDLEKVEHFERTTAAADIRVRSLARVRAVHATVMLTVDPRTIVGDAVEAEAKLMAVGSAFVRSVHIDDAAQKEWEPEAQQYMAMSDAMTRTLKWLRSGADLSLPISADEIKAILGRKAAPWISEPGMSAPDGPVHPVNLALKGAAALACNGQDGEIPTRAAMLAMSMSTVGKNGPLKKAEIASRLAADVLFPAAEKKGVVDRARTSLERAMRSRLFYDVKNHPSGLTDPWWSHIDDAVDDLVETARIELTDWQAGNTEDMGAGWFGPCGRALMFKALTVQTSSPAVRGLNEQLTQTGLGGDRGNTSASPEVVMARLLESSGGIAQLGEIVESGLGTTVRKPQNTIDPTVGPLTEEFLRGEAFGWPPKGGSEPSGRTRKPSEQAYTEKWEELSRLIRSAAEALADLTDPTRQDPDDSGRTLLDVFNERGFVAPSDGELMMAIHALQTGLTRANLLAERV